MNKSVIYTKSDCPYCVKAKYLLTQMNITYEEVVIGKDILREEFVSTFPEQKTVPLIFIDDAKVGGYEQLVKYFSPEQ